MGETRRHPDVFIPDYVAAYALGLKSGGSGRRPSWQAVSRFVERMGLGGFTPGDLEIAALRWAATVVIEPMPRRRRRRVSEKA